MKIVYGAVAAATIIIAAATVAGITPASARESAYEEATRMAGRQWAAMYVANEACELGYQDRQVDIAKPLIAERNGVRLGDMERYGRLYVTDMVIAMGSPDSGKLCVAAKMLFKMYQIEPAPL